MATERSSTERTHPPRAIPERTLFAAAGGLAVLIGLLRCATSFVDADATGWVVEATYFVIDVGLLFTLVAVYVVELSSRSRIGTVGFVLGVIGAGLLIGPEPTGSSVDLYAVGAASVSVGFALLALAWRSSTRFRSRTRVAFLGAVVVGALAGSSDAGFSFAGVLFGAALVDTGRALVIEGSEP